MRCHNRGCHHSHPGSPLHTSGHRSAEWQYHRHPAEHPEFWHTWLQNCHTAIADILYDNIAAPLAMLFVGFYHIASTSKDACKESVVKILPIVMVADGHAKQLGHFLCQSFAVSAPDCIKQRAAVPCLCTVIKPFAYSGFKISRISALGIISAEQPSGSESVDPYPAPWSDSPSDTTHSKDFPQRSADNRRSGFLQYAEQ